MKLWIARDKDGFIGLYQERPTWIKVNQFIEDWYGAFMGHLSSSSFTEVTFENSPQEVELKLVEL